MPEYSNLHVLSMYYYPSDTHQREKRKGYNKANYIVKIHRYTKSNDSTGIIWGDKGDSQGDRHGSTKGQDFAKCYAQHVRLPKKRLYWDSIFISKFI